MNEHNAMPSRLTLMALDDRKIIGYRPRLNAEVGSVLSTIVLCQAMYWAQHSGNPFYKFIQPCNHQLYRSGDAWVDELGFTRHEFEFAIKRIGQKITKASPDRDSAAYIWYWTDVHRVTWWQVNWQKINDMFDKAYPLFPESGNTYCQKVELPISSNLHYVNPKSGNTLIEQRVSSENNHRESSSSATRQAPDQRQDDDDDVMKTLIDIGLSREQAISARDRHGDLLCMEKAADLIRDKKITNLGEYARRTYANHELYAPAQAEAIRKRRVKSEERRVSKLSPTPEEFAVIEIPAATEEQLKGFGESIKNNSPLTKIWLRSGIDSYVIRVALAEYLRTVK